jgi:hypothetical protein
MWTTHCMSLIGKHSIEYHNRICQIREITGMLEQYVWWILIQHDDHLTILKKTNEQDRYVCFDVLTNDEHHSIDNRRRCQCTRHVIIDRQCSHRTMDIHYAIESIDQSHEYCQWYTTKRNNQSSFICHVNTNRNQNNHYYCNYCWLDYVHQRNRSISVGRQHSCLSL